jgi:hypothetical protein
MRLFRNLSGALSLALLLVVLSTAPARAQTLTALSLERSLALNNILTSITPQGISSTALAALASGALDLREQVNFNPSANTLSSTVFVVPTAAPNPTNLSQLPFASFVASTTMSIDKIYITSKPYNSVLFVGTVSQSTNTPYGNYLGATEDFSFGFTNDKPPKINNVIEVFGGAVVIYSASSQGTFTIVQPSTGGGGGTTGVSIVINGVTGTSPTFTTTVNQIQLNATASTSSNAGALTFAWSVVSGPASLSANGSVANVQLNGGKISYVIKLVVTDSTGATSTATIAISLL